MPGAVPGLVHLHTEQIQGEGLHSLQKGGVQAEAPKNNHHHLLGSCIDEQQQSTKLS